jgi:succinate dehydrogenase / fumarate reductase cytochrome b subunit
MQKSGVADSRVVTFKILAAASGLPLVGFVIVHMLGNLLVFGPGDWINRYAASIKGRPWLLWPARGFLFFSAMLHLWAVLSLWQVNRKGRSGSYHVWNPVETTLASRTMTVSGLVLGLFILFHIYHFTIHGPPFEHYDALKFSFSELKRTIPDVHSMLVEGFRSPLISLVYLTAMALLFFHLSHGVQSLFHSLGLLRRGWAQALRWVAWGIAGLVWLGFSAIPVAVLLGVVK